MNKEKRIPKGCKRYIYWDENNVEVFRCIALNSASAFRKFEKFKKENYDTPQNSNVPTV